MKTSFSAELLSDLDKFQSRLTSRIERDVPTWYGEDARLMGPPTFRSRNWSFFFRYLVRVSDTQVSAILVKMRHVENMGVVEAATNEQMGREIQDEYQSLELIEDIFSNLDDASYFYTIRLLGWYEDMNALMMEEADIRPLKVFFHKPQMWINRNEQLRFKTFFERTGRWLRIYHDHSGRVQEGVLFPKSLYDATQDKLQLIETASKLDLSFARKLLDDLHRKYGDKNVPYHVLHNNFSLNNVFVTQNEKICSFDPHNEPGPLYSDLAKIIVEMETSGIQIVTGGLGIFSSLLKSFAEAFLNGYFQNNPIDYYALNLFQFLVLIERWERNERKRLKAPGMKKYLYLFATMQLRNYYLRLLRKGAVEWEYGL